MLRILHQPAGFNPDWNGARRPVELMVHIKVLEPRKVPDSYADLKAGAGCEVTTLV